MQTGGTRARAPLSSSAFVPLPLTLAPHIQMMNTRFRRARAVVRARCARSWVVACVWVAACVRAPGAAAPPPPVARAALARVVVYARRGVAIPPWCASVLC